MCCASTKVRLNAIQEPPELLEAHFRGYHPKSKRFLEYTSAYNSAFQINSFGAKQINKGRFMSTFKAQE